MWLDLINVSFQTYILQVFVIDRNMGMFKPLFHKKSLMYFRIYT